MCGFKGKIKLGLDVAASEFYVDGAYDLGIKGGNLGKMNGDEFCSYY